MKSALARAFLLSLALAILAPAAAWAGSVTKPDTGGVKNRVINRYDLTKKERRALDIASVKATGKEGLGLLVEVTFRGNVERRLGRGHLKRAAIALILKPKSSQVKSTVLATRGAGARQRLLRHSRSAKVGAIRHGRKVTFVIRGSGLSGVRAIDVKSFAKLPSPKRGVRASQVLGDDGADQIEESDLEADLAELEDELDDIDPADLSCEELEDLLDDLSDLAADLRRLSRILKAADRELGRQIRRATRAGDMGEVADLQEARDAVSSARRQLKRTRTAVRELRDLVREELDDCPGGTVESLGAIFDWDYFGANEVYEQDGRFFVRTGQVLPADVHSPITAVRVVISLQISNYLCPTQLPTGAVSATSSSNDTLTCTGGSLPIDQPFRLNLRTVPNPPAGMGGQLYAQQDGVFKGPFTIAGP